MTSSRRTCSLRNKIKPKVSILCITYKHESFIRDTINAFITQETDFPFEILIGDDASPDKTGEIISEFAALFPDKIFPVLRKKNIGALRNLNNLISLADGDYFAYCEGDDYWSDNKKLQKQADFLDRNPDCTLCFHPVKQVFVDNSQPISIIDPFSFFDFSIADRNYFTMQELLTINFIASLSVMYRWQLGKSLPKWMLNHKIADYPIHLMHASMGKIGVINEVMGIYRKHQGGMWWNHNSIQHKKIYLEDFHNLLEDVNAHLDFKFDHFFKPVILNTSNEIKKIKEGEGVNDSGIFLKIGCENSFFGLKRLKHRAKQFIKRLKLEILN